MGMKKEAFSMESTYTHTGKTSFSVQKVRKLFTFQIKIQLFV